MEKKENLSVVFDRKGNLEKKGYGHVEIRVYFSRTDILYITVTKCSLKEWKKFQYSKTLLIQLEQYRQVIEKMITNKEELCKINFLHHIGGTPVEKKRNEVKTLLKTDGFVDFIEETEKKEKLSPATMKRNVIVKASIRKFGKLTRFIDLTERNLREYDKWLDDGTRTVVSIYNYHKVLKKYVRLAVEKRILESNPYDKFKVSRGKSKVRTPFNEDELVKLRNMKLNETLDRVRDLFIFCAYTGLAYIDSQNFSFNTMTDQVNGTYYIDGMRIKTGSKFYTPILPPALDVLKKYSYTLPKISNQKANMYLHVIESHGDFKKPMTTHIARHSFATLLLSHNVSMESVAKMMGHHDTRVTQIYAKLLNTTIHDNVENIIRSLK